MSAIARARLSISICMILYKSKRSPFQSDDELELSDSGLKWKKRDFECRLKNVITYSARYLLNQVRKDAKNTDK